MPRRVQEIVDALDRKSTRVPGQHWVFDRFRPFTGYVPVGHEADYIGTITSPRPVGRSEPSSPGEVWHNATPLPFNDEYVEWTDLLEAVLDADARLVFVELGAGFGRWTARAALAARQRGITDLRLVMVEGEPLHAQWAREHMALNGVAPEQYRLIEAAVGRASGIAEFIVEPPDRVQSETETAARWYGQCLATSANLGNPQRTAGEYNSCPTFRIEGGYTAIRVPVVTLETVLGGLSRIDLIDMDIQGEEGAVVLANVDLLSRVALRLHIETHSTAVESQVRDALSHAGWICLRDYPVLSSSNTPFGEIFFQGGVQSWINPRLL